MSLMKHKALWFGKSRKLKLASGSEQPTARRGKLKSDFCFRFSVFCCGLFLLAGCGKEAEQESQRLAKELETVRAELEEVKTERANLQNETARLRKDNEDLLRLRNEVRQLRDEQKQLTQQAKSAQNEIQKAQAQMQAVQAEAQLRARQQELLQQAQAAQAQAQALGTNAAQALTPEQQAFAQRYGLAARPATPQDQANACINSLRLIDSAKQQWALENRKTADAVATVQDIAAYLRGGALSKCPAGGNYTLNAVSAHPTCSIPGHALPP
jgi:septal ring factor EnvC (AmiA/AmiB activator)